MKIGTRSLLYGVHAVWLHPFFVAWGWYYLYGIPWDPRLWVAFIVHDWGLWGCADLDGKEGTSHPELGARIMGRLFGRRWSEFCLYHSRYYSKRDGKNPSRLALADKMAIVVEPAWLYLPRARLTGEIAEYMGQAATWISGEPVSKEEARRAISGNDREWLIALKSYLKRWVDNHIDEGTDTWTANRESTGKH